MIDLSSLILKYKLWRFDKKYSKPGQQIFRYSSHPNGLIFYDIDMEEGAIVRDLIQQQEPVEEICKKLILHRRSKIS